MVVIPGTASKREDKVKISMKKINRHGRILLAALLGAALFLFIAGCKTGGENGSGQSPEVSNAGNGSAGVRQTVRQGIGPDPENGGGLMYEEFPQPGVSDYTGKIDFAISQAMQRSGLDLAGLKARPSGEMVEHDGHLYHAKTIEIYDIKDIPAFVQALRDSLLAWAERATLARTWKSSAPEELVGQAWEVELAGAVTHTIFLFSRPGKPEDKRPRMVVVLDDLGESKKQARRLLALNYPVTFAIWPHSTHAKAVAKMARDAGAEIIIHQPMQPEGYPGVNPGKGVLLAGMSREDILTVLDESMRLVPGATGLNNHMGSRLTQDEETMRFVSNYLHQNNFLILDSLTHAKSRFSKAAAEAGGQAYKRDVFLDVEADKDKVLAQLRKAEQVALVKGQAIAIGHPLSATLEALEEWEKVRDTRITVVRLKDLTPIKAVSNLREE